MSDIVERIREVEAVWDRGESTRRYNVEDLIVDAADEIESLRKEVEKYHKAQQDFYIPNAALRAQVAELEKERDEWKESAINGGNAGYLREKVAELEKDLDTERRLSFRTQVGILEQSLENLKASEKMYKKSKEYAFEDLRKAQARIAELREAFDLIYSWANNWDSEFMNDHDWKNEDFPKIQSIVTRADDTQALEAYRNAVIAELEKERGYDPVTISENTMNKYRNAVIDECIEYSDCVSGEYLRGLKR